MQLLNKVFILLVISVAVCPNVFANWKKIKSNTLAWFHTVYFVNPNKGWIVGSGGTMLLTEDGGENWTVVKSFTKDTIRDVYFTDESHGWILTEKNIFGSGQSSPSAIFETNDGGKNWDRVKIEGEGKERLTKFFFTKEGIGRAVGEAGTMFELQAETNVWKRVNLLVRYLLLGGSFINQSRGVIVGGGGTAFFTEDAGKNWKPSVFTIKPETKLNSVFFINQNIGWIVGAGGKIYSTNDGGKHWREQHSEFSEDLFDVFFKNTAEGWAVGDKGTILYTRTAGNIWQKESVATEHKLESVFFDGNKTWAVGFGGTILVRSEKEL